LEPLKNVVADPCFVDVFVSHDAFCTEDKGLLVVKSAAVQFTVSGTAGDK